jgi:molecular chaperone GrpE
MSEQDAGDAEAAAAEDEPAAESPVGFEEWLASVLDEDVETADPDGDLVEHVSDTDDESLATEVATLRALVERLQARVDERDDAVEDLESRLARKQADFQNYKQRQQQRLEDEKARATEDLVERLLDVRDNLARALDQDEGADIRGGVESTLGQFDREFEREGVEPIEPDPGEPTDPTRHEVLMRVESDEPAETVADVHRAGYEMAGKVLRAAQVTVSEGPEAEDKSETGDGQSGEEA